MKLRVRRAQHRDEPRILDLLLQVNNLHADGRPDIFMADQRKYTVGQLSLLIDDDTRPILWQSTMTSMYTAMAFVS